jgi:hypothetical protein
MRGHACSSSPPTAARECMSVCSLDYTLQPRPKPCMTVCSRLLCAHYCTLLSFSQPTRSRPLRRSRALDLMIRPHVTDAPLHLHGRARPRLLTCHRTRAPRDREQATTRVSLRRFEEAGKVLGPECPSRCMNPPRPGTTEPSATTQYTASERERRDRDAAQAVANHHLAMTEA